MIFHWILMSWWDWQKLIKKMVFFFETEFKRDKFFERREVYWGNGRKGEGNKKSAGTILKSDFSDNCQKRFLYSQQLLSGGILHIIMRLVSFQRTGRKKWCWSRFHRSCKRLPIRGAGNLFAGRMEEGYSTTKAEMCWYHWLCLIWEGLRQRLSGSGSIAGCSMVRCGNIVNFKPYFTFKVFKFCSTK